MTPARLAQYVRFKTKTNATTLPDDDIKMLAEIHMDRLAARIIKVNEDYFGTPSTADLVANQREYPFPSDILSKIKYVEAKLDGTNWITLDELDLNSPNFKQTTDESAITSRFTNEQGNAFFDIFRGSLWLFSGTISAVEEGLKLWSFSWPTHMTDMASTIDLSQDPEADEHGFPRQFHDILARLIIREVRESGDKPLAGTETELAIEKDILMALDNIADINLSRAVVAPVPKGSRTWNDGQDL